MPQSQITNHKSQILYSGGDFFVEDDGALGLNLPFRSASYSLGTGGSLAASPFSCRASRSTISACPRQVVILPNISIVLPSSWRTSPTSFRLEGKTTTVNGQSRYFSQKLRKNVPLLLSATFNTFPVTQAWSPILFSAWVKGMQTAAALDATTLESNTMTRVFTGVLDGSHQKPAPWRRQPDGKRGPAWTALPVGLLGGERSDCGGLVVLNVEHGVQLRDLQQVVDFLGQVQQLQIPASVAYRGEGADQFADA